MARKRPHRIGYSVIDVGPGAERHIPALTFRAETPLDIDQHGESEKSEMAIPSEANGLAREVGATTSLILSDPSEIPADPDPDLYYKHKGHLWRSAKRVWARREIVLILAERDIRATYKQTTLGFGWTILGPVASLLVLTFVFKRVKSFQVTGIPYAVYLYPAILAWGFFASSVGSGANSLLANIGLLSKVHFPKECFPLSQIVEAAVNTFMASTVLILLFVIYGYVPHVQMLWIPVFIIIEVIFCAGVTVAASALLVHVRDLVQMLPMLLQIGMFATPVIWPLSKIPHNLQPLYAFVNPLGPVINNVRGTMLQGQSPTWGLLGIATLGALIYLMVGYAIFKRLETVLVDIA